MFMASPSMTRPGVACTLGGRKLFGMLRRPPFSKAAAKLGCTDRGRLGSTTFCKCAFTPPAEGEAEGVWSGTSMRARVSWEPIW